MKLYSNTTYHFNEGKMLWWNTKPILALVSIKLQKSQLLLPTSVHQCSRYLY